MSQQLRDLHAKLKYLREYVIKLGPNRRTEDLGFKKLEETEKENSKLKCILTQLNQEVKDQKLDKESCDICQTLIDELIFFERVLVKLMLKI